MGRELGLRGKKGGRSYVKHLESKTHPWFLRPGMAAKLMVLMQTTKPGTKLVEPKRTLIFTRYVLPAKLSLYVRPRRCRGHRRMCVMVANQVYCGVTAKERAECRRVWRRRVRREEKEAED